MNILYENHFGEKINLYEWPIVIEDPEKLFENGWNYTQADKSIYDFEKISGSINVKIQIFADSKDEFKDTLEKFLEITEKDVYEECFGKLWVNEYYMNCFITAGNYENYEEDFYSVDKAITISFPEWYWIRTEKHQYKGKLLETGLDYEHDYPHDYSLNHSDLIEYDKTILPADFQIDVYGPVDNPSIQISGHEYSVLRNVAEEEVLTINSLTKKIFITNKISSEITNCFDERDRDSYIFEKIPAGKILVNWDNTFSFDLTLIEKRSEPKWI